MSESEKAFTPLEHYLQNQHEDYGFLIHVLESTIVTVCRPFDGAALWQEAKTIKAANAEKELAPEVELFLDSLIKYVNFRGRSGVHSIVTAEFNESVKTLALYHLTNHSGYSSDSAHAFLFFNPPPSIVLRAIAGY